MPVGVLVRGVHAFYQSKGLFQKLDGFGVFAILFELECQEGIQVGFNSESNYLLGREFLLGLSMEWNLEVHHKDTKDTKKTQSLGLLFVPFVPLWRIARAHDPSSATSPGTRSLRLGCTQ